MLILFEPIYRLLKAGTFRILTRQASKVEFYALSYKNYYFRQ